MANGNGSKGRSRTASNRNKGTRKQNNVNISTEPAVSPLIVVLAVSAIAVLLFISNLGRLGTFGDILSKILFGIFGMPAYALPVLMVILVFALYSAKESLSARRRVICMTVIYICISMLFELTGGITGDTVTYPVKDMWERGATMHKGGGVVFGSVAFFLNRYLSTFGTVVVIIIMMLIAILLFMGRDALERISAGGRQMIDNAGEDASVRYNEAKERIRRAREIREYNEDGGENDKELPRYAKKRRGIGVGIGSSKGDSDGKESDRYPDAVGEPLTDEQKVPRINKKVSGVAADVRIGDNVEKDNRKKRKSAFERDDMHEITVGDISEDDYETEKAHAVARNPHDSMADVTFGRGGAGEQTDIYDDKQKSDDDADIEIIGASDRPAAKPIKAVGGMAATTLENKDTDMKKAISKSKSVNKAYRMPPLSLLNKSESKANGNSKNELLDTAKLLQDTLETFGVKAKVTDISQGPSVTRFELQPEVGVRVNKIVSLADDIKLSLAATDIRIEAPIPGKSAVGIEVPNKESTGVGLRELLEDKSFKDFESKICFAVGKDIAGKTIVADIAKMPHMLIAGATGSGKSVCINTIIMSILYKAHPDDVKLIMVDPKVVELSVYNGIPHLMIPVVTDPKKAAAALHWGVAEMTERYKKFADFNVRDLKGYNKAIEDILASGRTTDDEGNEIHKLPQIVIIVDELADLMMVAAKEVEESICRIAQLARACGIHLIIATQRPSVDVITGLIKANMPSRVAFAVSSGVDSRTILDMNGAEKLLGKGDMLFFPQGYPKPARVQGAFVSDAEVSQVVKFLKDQDYVGVAASDIENKISAMSAAGGTGDSGNTSDETDDLFTEAGKFIIAQDKASIGSLQRKFKIGFNRAARIMDQLCEAGVVSEENGTKPREVLMSTEQFMQYVEEYV